MELSHLTAISPIDGRYRDKLTALAPYFSEYALFKYRVHVEVEYFIALTEIPLSNLKDFPTEKIPQLRSIVSAFSEKDALAIKEYEKKINHDVKAVEYFIKDKLVALGCEKWAEFVHFGLTSQDINNTSIPLSLKEATENEYYPLLNEVLQKLSNLANEWKDIPLLARTHGQPASPTKLDKEILVFAARLEAQIKLLKQVPYSAKFGGATGNMNAHYAAYPEIDWKQFADNFVSDKLTMDRSFPTTQIEHYDNLAALFDGFKRINTILLDLSRDVWTYIAMDYFKQKINKDEVGSSAMPHKVNPIDFENAEGNLGIANAIYEHLSAKLPISRLQRDLTDSTVLRNVGVPFGHTVLAFKSLLKGLNKLLVNKEKIRQDLDDNWMVLAEAIQTVLRREGYPKPYEKLKELTRKNEKVTQDSIHAFIDTLEVSDAIKTELKAFTPFNYTGK